MLKDEQNKAQIVKDMYTKNLIKKRVKGNLEEVPEALVRIVKRKNEAETPSVASSRGKKAIIRKPKVKKMRLHCRKLSV